VNICLLIQIISLYNTYVKRQETRDFKQEERERNYQDIIKQRINKSNDINSLNPENSTITVK